MATRKNQPSVNPPATDNPSTPTTDIDVDSMASALLNNPDTLAKLLASMGAKNRALGKLATTYESVKAVSNPETALAGGVVKSLTDLLGPGSISLKLKADRTQVLRLEFVPTADNPVVSQWIVWENVPGTRSLEADIVDGAMSNPAWANARITKAEATRFGIATTEEEPTAPVSEPATTEEPTASK